MSIPYEIILWLTGTLAVLQIINLMIPEKKQEKGIDIGSCMTIGNREVQEDAFAAMETESGVLAVLADGMGKAYGGRIASRIAVETFTELFLEYNAFDNPQYYFRKAFHCANKEILKALEDERRGAASVACAMIRDGYLYYAVVGNVKICVFRDGDLIPVSTGHTIQALAEEYFKEGKITRQDALAVLENHRLFNYVGQDGFRDIELFDTPISLKEEDIVLLMSDGVHELLAFKELEEVLSGKGSAQEMSFQIIEAVNQHRKTEKDNASIILLNVGNGVSK